MSIVCTVGISHRTASVALRELVSLSAAGIIERLKQLKQHCQVEEATILSTCNRTEVYCLADRPEVVVDWLSHSIDPAAREHLYHLQSRAAITHLFRVASGLDSLLVGEPEITGQVKQIAALARQAHSSGVTINRLIDSALAAAKAVRTNTAIGRHSLSYGTLAARAAANIFPNLRDTAVLFVGAGDMCLAGAPVFADRGVQRLAVAGRSAEKTEKVAAQVGADTLSIARLPHVLAEFDIILSATASQVPIIGKGAVESALRHRRQKPMMFADLAVPRDLETEVQTLANVFVYTLDQFSDMISYGQQERETAATQATKIIEQHVDRFCQWLNERKNTEPVRHLRADAANMRDQETDRALAQLANGNNPEQVIRHLAHRLTNQLTHLPTKWLLSQPPQPQDKAREASVNQKTKRSRKSLS